MEAERLHTGASATVALLNRFQAWLHARYPWALGRPWYRILLFQNLWDPQRALTGFWTYFDLFRSGAPPHALTPVGKRMFKTNPGLEDMSEQERESWRRRLNEIFYTE
jgi:hypothetical protein